MLIRNLIIFLLLSGPLSANELFDKGYKAAQDKNFSEAILHFEALVSIEPANSSALFNLGNAYFAEKKYGKAILNFEKAHKLQPGDDEIQLAITNTYAALGRSDNWDSAYTFLESTFFRIGSFTWSILALFFSLFSAFLLFILIARVKRIVIPFKVPLLFFSLFLIVLFSYAASKAVIYSEDNRFAIVTSEKIPILKNEFGEMSDRTLNEGERVEIIKELDSYLLVLNSTGEEVLVMSTDVERIQTF